MNLLTRLLISLPSDRMFMLRKKAEINNLEVALGDLKKDFESAFIRQDIIETRVEARVEKREKLEEKREKLEKSEIGLQD